MPHIVDIGASFPNVQSNNGKLIAAGWSATLFECEYMKHRALAYTYLNNPNVAVDGTKVTPDNIVALLEKHHVPTNFDLLSIDMDGYDYFVLDALLEKFHPLGVIAEVNEKIPPPLFFTILYHPDYWWDVSHCYSMSIAALGELAGRRGYKIVDLIYNNALLEPLDGPNPAMTPQEAYDRGYRNQLDRKERFPHNAMAECALTMTPDQAVEFFDKMFVNHRGQYVLRSKP